MNEGPSIGFTERGADQRYASTRHGRRRIRLPRVPLIDVIHARLEVQFVFGSLEDDNAQATPVRLLQIESLRKAVVEHCVAESKQSRRQIPVLFYSGMK